MSRHSQLVRQARRAMVLVATTLLVAGFAAVPARAETTVTISGLIRDRVTDEPVAGACVVIFNGWETTIGKGCSGADGRYEITEVSDPEGFFKARVEAAGYSTTWWGDGINFGSAPWVAVPENAVDFRLFVGGTIRGRVVDHRGAAVSGATVRAELADFYSSFARVTTASDGSYELAGLRPENYKIQIMYGIQYQWQWVPQVHKKADAQRVTVASGSDQTVDVAMLPPYADVTVNVIDKVTGQAVTQGCVEFGEQRDCAPQAGQFQLTGLPLGPNRDFVVHPEPTHWPIISAHSLFSGPNTVTVAVDDANTIRSRLVDAADATKGVKGCVYPVNATFPGRLPAPPRPSDVKTVEPNVASCSAADGTVVIGPLRSESVNLFVLPDAPYGAQWVGALGRGTGDQRLARRVGATGDVQIAPIKVDRGGTIRGWFWHSPGGCASPLGANAQSLRIPIVSCTPDNGTPYQLANLGPYDWPLNFYTAKPATWSDQTYFGTWHGSANRYQAPLVKVTAGQTRTVDGNNYFDAVIPVFTVLPWPSGTRATLDAYDPVTGDLLAHSLDSDYRMGLEVPRRKIMIRYTDTQGHDCWLSQEPPTPHRRGPARLTLDYSGYARGQLLPDVPIQFGVNCVTAKPPIDVLPPPRRTAPADVLPVPRRSAPTGFRGAGVIRPTGRF